MGGKTAWVLGDQLSHANPALEGADRVLIVESRAKLGEGNYHRQKLHLVLSAMRHFAAELREKGIEVDYRRSRSLGSGLRAHLREHRPDSVRLLEPASIRGAEALPQLDRVELVEGGLFLTSPSDFAEWAGERKQLRMENFYREQRRRFDLLIEGGEPAGGRWNFDSENRERPPRDQSPPHPYRPREDEIDERVRRDLDSSRLRMWGEDGPRLFAATHDQARRALDDFIANRLPDFGRWQDAMLAGESFMWHSLVSAPLNLGLIDPLRCARAAEKAYQDGAAPLAAVEGFIRQLIGWREYVWGLYRLKGKRWARMNALGARTALPDAFRDGETEMSCLGDVTAKVRGTGYAHHIERLMVLGNLALLLGVDPRQIHDYFHRGFVDGYEWVMGPNVLGMASWADGGEMMSKPYAASGRYVDRMSNHCKGCRYEPGERTGEDACPLTTLYWDFLARNRDELAGNNRMKMAYRNLDRLDGGELDEIRSRALGLRRSFLC